MPHRVVRRFAFSASLTIGAASPNSRRTVDIEHTTKDGKSYYGGVVGWAQAGFPFVNQFAGEFTIHKYATQTTEEGEYHIRLFHPY